MNSIEISIDHHKLRIEYELHGEYIPEKRYLSNGDPGYPAEYPELEIETVELYHPKYKKWREIEYENYGKLSDILDDKCYEIEMQKREDSAAQEEYYKQLKYEEMKGEIM